MIIETVGVIIGLFLVAQPLLYGIDVKTAGGNDLVFASLFVVACVMLAWSVFATLRLTCKRSSVLTSSQTTLRSRATPQVLTITQLDIAVVAYLLYGLLNVVLVHHAQADLLWWFKWTALAGGYAVFRVLPDKKIVAYALIFSGVVQSFIAIGQYLWWFDSNHLNFRITGSFGNPGQLGGYLAVCFTIAFWQMADKFANIKTAPSISARLMNWAAVAATTSASVMIGAGLILADSRAGVIAALSGSAFYYFNKVKLNTARRKIITVATFVVLAASLFAILFLYRPGSAQARLFTWRVSADMIADKPIAGHGVGSFNDNYMLYQAKYFSGHPDSGFLAIADNVSYPYNELVHICIEQGAIGVILVVILFWLAFSVHKKGNASIRAALLALIIFSMFSYPANTFPIMFLFAVLFGCVGIDPVKQFRINKVVTIAVAALSIFLLTVTGFGYSRYAGLSVSLRSLHESNKHNLQEQAIIKNNYQAFRNNRVLRDIYIVWLADNTAEESDLKLITEITPICESYIAVGDAFIRFRRYKEAEDYYNTASDMIPTRMMPNYKLWKLYLETGDTVKAVDAARKLILQQLKAENTLNIRKRAEVKQWLMMQNKH